MGRLDDFLASVDAANAAYIEDEITLPDGTRVPYRMVLPDKATQMAERIAADRELARTHGLVKTESTAEYFDEAQLIRILAASLRDRDDVARPLAAPETLLKLSDIELAKLADRYEDLRASADTRDDEISPGDVVLCDELIKKNFSPADTRQLFRSIGFAKLVSYAITTVRRLTLCQRGAYCSTCGSATPSMDTSANSSTMQPRQSAQPQAAAAGETPAST